MGSCSSNTLVPIHDYNLEHSALLCRAPLHYRANLFAGSVFAMHTGYRLADNFGIV